MGKLQLPIIEDDIITDLVHDSHELWEWYVFVRSNEPELSEPQVLQRGRELLAIWISRGWLKFSVSRRDQTALSGEQILTLVDQLGDAVNDATKAVAVIDLTEKALVDTGLPRPQNTI